MRILALLVAATLATGCAQRVWDGDERVARAAYSNGKPPSVTLITVVRNDLNVGTHSALVVNGSERVLFDPAGSWKHPRSPERNDLRFGIDDRVLAHFLDYHTRRSHRTIVQEVAVPASVADAVTSSLAQAGPAAPGFCALTISRALRRVEGFGAIGATPFPSMLMRDFGRLSGARTRVFVDDDPADNRYLLRFPPDSG
jgi:hypothetical protein